MVYERQQNDDSISIFEKDDKYEEGMLKLLECTCKKRVRLGKRCAVTGLGVLICFSVGYICGKIMGRGL